MEMEKELTFKIDKIDTERSRGGLSTIDATCIETSLKVKTVINSEFLNDKARIRRALLEGHIKVSKSLAPNIKVGDII